MSVTILPRIESKAAFEQLAGAFGVQVKNLSDACRADNVLRSKERGYAPASLLRAWYGCYGYARHNAA